MIILNPVINQNSIFFPFAEPHGPNRRGETWAPQQDAQNGKGNGGGNFIK